MTERDYVLVAGAWQGAWLWESVARELTALGHRVHAVTLSGLGERAGADLGSIGPQTHVDDVLAVLESRDLHDVILVGHLYGGVVVGQVADRAPERVARVVYVEAFLAGDGKAMRSEPRWTFRTLEAGHWPMVTVPGELVRLLVEAADAEPVGRRYPGVATGAATAWSEAAWRLASADGYWLATTRPDSRPHLVPVLAVWVDGALHFAAGPGTRKGRNLRHDPRCTLSTRQPGLDLVVEGVATRVVDAAVLRRVAEEYATKYGWPVEVRDGTFEGEGAPTAGPPPYEVHRLDPAIGFAFPTDETFAPTRWEFG